ncbi:MAG: sigma-54-dependent transcriptional regulator [Sandaracinaceae bacterium]
MTRVLVVDDEENIRLVLRTLLRKAGYDVGAVGSGEEAIEALDAEHATFVLADVRMNGMSGLELTRRVMARPDPPTVIVMSAYGSVELAIDAMKAGAYDYVSKPFKPDEILLALRKAEERESLRRENRSLRAQVRAASVYADMVGRSDAMQELYRTVEKAAAYSTTVLVQGESGTGKELVARALHERGPRADRAFVPINCGAIPEALLESELFGHVKGAFTDARADRAGLFEEAHGGTLFLDEIGELPLGVQVKLLRVLQEGTLRRLGDTADRTVDVRVIAATVRRLADEVREKRFREDLFYRLNVLTVEVPALRDRRDDIPLLIDHFLAQLKERLGTTLDGVSPAARRRLLAYHWPGNVRELQNVLERAAVLGTGPLLEEADLPDRLQDPDPVQQVLTAGELSIKKSTRVIEEALIRRALAKTGGNRTQASRLLEISHRALLYKMKDYGVT